MSDFLLALAVLPVILILKYIYGKDLNPEPKSMVNSAFWVGLFMAIPAVFLEQFLDKFYAIEQSQDVIECFCTVLIGVALVEEFVKWVVVIFQCYNHKEFDEVYDGIVYTVYASLGFACIENILYVATGGVQTGIQRALLSVPGHACFGILMGYFLGKAKICGKKGRTKEETKYMLLSLLAPTFLHTVYDFLLFGNAYFEIPEIVFYIFVGIQYIVCLSLILKISKKNERIIDSSGVHYCGKCGNGCETQYCTNCGFQNK